MNEAAEAHDLGKEDNFLGSVFLNTYHEIPFWYDAVGFRTNTLKYFSPDSVGDSKIAEDFLVNSKNFIQDKEFQSSVMAFFQDSQLMMVYNQADPWKNKRQFDYSGFKRFELTEGVRLRVSFGEVIKSRRTRREFTGDPMYFRYLTSILRCASGVSGYGTTHLSDNSKVEIAFRTVASGGGLYPNDLIIVVLRSDDLPKGIYKYIPKGDEKGDYLIKLADTVDQVMQAFPQNDISMKINNAGVIFLIATTPWKSMKKYGSRGMRFIFLEAGAISQNIHLACSALGIGSCDFGGYLDEDLDRSLGFDGISQTVIHTIITGII